jgi:uncharacterized protein YdcH (DUF465 family)
MVEGLQDLKQHMMATNDEFQRLATEHQQYKQRLQELAGKTYLTGQEQLEEVRMKKVKLHLKDQMEHMMQQYRKQAQSM